MKKIGLGLLTLILVTAVYFNFRSFGSVSDTEESPTPSILPFGVQKQTSTAEPSSEKLVAVEELTQTVRNNSLPQEERTKALYELTQLGAKALSSLTLIATTPLLETGSQDPHSVDQINQSFELGLRVTALEALDELSIDPQWRPSVAASMLEVLKIHKHRSLTLLAQISLSGIESGRPGKVKRAIDTLLKEKE